MSNLFRKQIDRHFASSKALAGAFARHARPASGPVQVAGPKGAYLSLVLDALHAKAAGPSLVVTPTEREAESIVQDIESFGTRKAVHFPWWGTAPYEGASPLASIFGERVQILSRLLARDPLTVVAPLRALLTPVPDPAYLSAQIFTVTQGQTAGSPGNRGPAVAVGVPAGARASPCTASSPSAAR